MTRFVPREFSLFGMGLRGDRFTVATCAASTAIWIATCGRPDVADITKLRVLSPLSVCAVKNLSIVQTWDWGKVKKEENDAGVWGPQ